MASEEKCGALDVTAVVEAAVAGAAPRLAVSVTTDDDVCSIAAALARCGSLRVLDLRRGRFGARGAGALGSLLKGPSSPPLIRLDVSGVCMCV